MKAKGGKPKAEDRKFRAVLNVCDAEYFLPSSVFRLPPFP